jgi:hypothetical protein
MQVLSEAFLVSSHIDQTLKEFREHFQELMRQITTNAVGVRFYEKFSSDVTEKIRLVGIIIENDLCCSFYTIITREF